MRTAWRPLHLALLPALVVVAVVAACGPVAPSAPSGPSSPAATQSPATIPSGTDAPSSAVVDIEVLVASMEAAVRAADQATYLDLVDLSDPVFALEHTRWSDEWAGPSPVAEYALGVSDLAVAGEAATGTLSVTWMLQTEDESRTATFPARFTRNSLGWRYAGEVWVPTEVPHFRILVAPGLEGWVPGIEADLPRIYDRVTAALGHEPAGSMEIKAYADPQDLVANTLLSLPTILGWNEPGEALKLQVESYQPLQPGAPVLSSVIAHEFSHFLGFDRAGTQRSRMPWWLDEGVATYVAREFEGPGARDRLAQVIDWNAAGELADWEAMAVFEEAPRELWQFAYPQGYAMVRYVTEEYGVSSRNAWLAAMATEMDIAEATPSALGLTFEELDAGFRAWLTDR
jgi:hypothetical protein